MLKSITGMLLLSFASLTFATEDTTQPQVSQAETEAISPEQQAFNEAMSIWQSLTPISGNVTLDKANAFLEVPESFVFFNGSDANKILVDLWGNPASQPPLGLLMPANMTPFDAESWVVTVEYEQDGYVSDEDAKDIDYDDLLKQMQADTEEQSKYRVQQGYEPIELVGWASSPFYDHNAKKLHWAQELKFGQNAENTLNYNIRVLGRKGVLVLNFIAGMEHKPVIDQNLETVLAMANFQRGAQYSDFDPSIDEVAAYGIGALVAGKVIAKTGFLAVLLVFLKKFGVYLLIGLGFVAKKLFSRKKATSEE